MWGHVGRPGGDAGERLGVGKHFSQVPPGSLSSLRHLLSWILFCRPHSEDLHPGLHPSELECPHLFVSSMNASHILPSWKLLVNGGDGH